MNKGLFLASVPALNLVFYLISLLLCAHYKNEVGLQHSLLGAIVWVVLFVFLFFYGVSQKDDNMMAPILLTTTAFSAFVHAVLIGNWPVIILNGAIMVIATVAWILFFFFSFLDEEARQRDQDEAEAIAIDLMRQSNRPQ